MAWQNAEVLVLNSDYQPLNVTNVRRAVVLVYLGKADVLHTDSFAIATIKRTIEAPTVVRLRHHIKRPTPQIHLSRRTILARDDYTCQYCGRVADDLTVDHVIPRRLGGESTWENLVCCCRYCNVKKGDRTLRECGFKLRRRPERPKYISYISLNRYTANVEREDWRLYFPS
jgi:5-methylcytosine-specific restriction endonuclease McrA